MANEEKRKEILELYTNERDIMIKLFWLHILASEGLISRQEQKKLSLGLKID